jgi:hypothetical protein
VEERSQSQQVAEVMVSVSVDDSPADWEAQKNPQPGGEPGASVPGLTEVLTEHPAATVSVLVAMETVDGSTTSIGGEGDSLESSEPELETEKRFMASSTPRMSQEEKLKHFYRNLKRN